MPSPENDAVGSPAPNVAQSATTSIGAGDAGWRSSALLAAKRRPEGPAWGQVVDSYRAFKYRTLGVASTQTGLSAYPLAGSKTTGLIDDILDLSTTGRVDHTILTAGSDWVMELPYFQLSTVDFFAPSQSPVRTGAPLPLSSRPYLHRFFAFPLVHAQPQQTYFPMVPSTHHLLFLFPTTL